MRLRWAPEKVQQTIAERVLDIPGYEWRFYLKDRKPARRDWVFYPRKSYWVNTDPIGQNYYRSKGE